MTEHRARFLSIACCAFALALGAGCGGGSQATDTSTTPPPPDTSNQASAGPVHEHGDSIIRTTVGPAGGTLELSNGARLEIPAGAIPQPANVIFSEGANSRVFAHSANTHAIGPVVQLQPAVQLAPGAKLKLSIPFMGIPSGFQQDDLALGTEVPDEEQRALDQAALRTRWQYGVAHVVGERLVGDVTQCPGLRYQFLAAR